MITTICDTHWGRKYKHSTIATIITIISALTSLFYSTGFGYEATNAVDAQISNISLIFVVWAECVCATSFYRFVDVIGQVGTPSFWLYQCSYIGAQIIGNAVAHSVSDKIGAGVGFGVYIAGTVIAVALAKDPTVPAPRFWGRNKLLNRIWWFALYSVSKLLHLERIYPLIQCRVTNLRATSITLYASASNGDYLSSGLLSCDTLPLPSCPLSFASHITLSTPHVATPYKSSLSWSPISSFWLFSLASSYRRA